MNRDCANDVYRVAGSQAVQAQGLLQWHLALPGDQFIPVTGPKVLQSQFRQQIPLLPFLHGSALLLPGLGHCRVSCLSGKLISPLHYHLPLAQYDQKCRQEVEGHDDPPSSQYSLDHVYCIYLWVPRKRKRLITGNEFGGGSSR